MMKNEKICCKSHMKRNYSSIIGKDIYPVAFNPLEDIKECIHEMNIRAKKNYHCSFRSDYKFKDVVYRDSLFVDLDI